MILTKREFFTSSVNRASTKGDVIPLSINCKAIQVLTKQRRHEIINEFFSKKDITQKAIFKLGNSGGTI